MTKIIMNMASAQTWRQTVQERAKHHRSSPERDAAKYWIAHNGLDQKTLSMLGKGAKISRRYPNCKVTPPGLGGTTRCDAFIFTMNRRKRLICLEPTTGTCFSKTIEDWHAEAETQSQTKNRKYRLETMCQILGLGQNHSPSTLLKYKFFYKTYAAVKLAEKIDADEAILIVQSFSGPSPEFSDFVDFCKQFGVVPVIGKLSKPAWCGEIKLRLGWIEC